MHLYMLVTVWISVTTAAAQLYCDPLTQYEKDGRCCLMCEPGTCMMAMSSCEEPQCKECRENEYQDTHTTASICKRQPYCDPNRNFQVVVHPSKTSRSACLCQHGFHCSSEECFTCVPHTVCQAGFGALHKGNHSQDTVCQECAVGTFSNQSSWDRACETWTKCEEGYYVEKGTNASDNRCAKSNRERIIVLVVFVLVTLLTIGAVIFLCRRKTQRSKQQPKDAEMEIKKPLQIEAELDELHGPTDNLKPTEENRTDNGTVVTQEDGKPYIISQQESQTAEFEV